MERVEMIQVTIYLDDGEVYINGFRVMSDEMETDLRESVINNDAIRKYLISHGWKEEDIKSLTKSE